MNTDTAAFSGQKGLSADSIKWIAIIAMLIDHIAWAFVPTYSALGQVMHIIGRITGPTMCFFIAEGYAHTHDIRRYLMRLGIFAVISQEPYQMLEGGHWGLHIGFGGFSVIFTLFCSLLAVLVWDRVKNPALKFLTIAGLMLVACLGDWALFEVIFSLIFWSHRGDFRSQARDFAIAATGMVVLATLASLGMGKPATDDLFQFGVLLCLPILSRYNGRRGGGKYSKWTFYIFYPLHLFIIGLIAHPALLNGIF